METNNKKAVAPATQKKEVVESGNIFVIRPRTTSQKVFHFKTFNEQNLKELIGFVGIAPQINTDFSLSFKKAIVKAGDFIAVNEFGEVINVISEKLLSERFDIVTSRPFTKEDINNVKAKERKARETKS